MKAEDRIAQHSNSWPSELRAHSHTPKGELQFEPQLPDSHGGPRWPCPAESAAPWLPLFPTGAEVRLPDPRPPVLCDGVRQRRRGEPPPLSVCLLPEGECGGQTEGAEGASRLSAPSTLPHLEAGVVFPFAGGATGSEGSRALSRFTQLVGWWAGYRLRHREVWRGDIPAKSACQSSALRALTSHSLSPDPVPHTFLSRADGRCSSLAHDCGFQPIWSHSWWHLLVTCVPLLSRCHVLIHRPFMSSPLAFPLVPAVSPLLFIPCSFFFSRELSSPLTWSFSLSLAG